MPISGAKPTGRPTVNRNKPTYEWTTVDPSLYNGWRPELPDVRQVMVKNGDVQIVPIEPRTRDWWEAVSTMPHCRLWSKSDWSFALDTAMVHASAVYGSVTASAELRQREKVLGTTLDARRDLRIRYSEDGFLAQSASAVSPAPVAQISERRARLLNDS